ncbi:MAG: hypothetical protein GX241_02090 [Ruminococcaceae bacterium]|nr:hypothetical protein [Oscillospiraceae bacterium]
MEEKAIWHGQPNPKNTRTKFDFLFIPLSLFIFCAGIFWRIALTYASFPLKSLSYALVLLGIYLLFIRNSSKKRRRKKLSYEMTEKDIIIVQTLKKDLSIRTLAFENIKYVGYSIRKNGEGTIYFNFPKTNKDLVKFVFMNGGLFRFEDNLFIFFEIDDVEDTLAFLKTKTLDGTIYEEI